MDGLRNINKSLQLLSIIQQWPSILATHQNAFVKTSEMILMSTPLLKTIALNKSNRFRVRRKILHMLLMTSSFTEKETEAVEG